MTSELADRHAPNPDGPVTSGDDVSTPSSTSGTAAQDPRPGARSASKTDADAVTERTPEAALAAAANAPAPTEGDAPTERDAVTERDTDAVTERDAAADHSSDADAVTEAFTLDIPAGADDAATPGVDEVLGRQVALVALPPVTGPQLVVRTEQVRRLARLHHPHLCEVFDVDGLADDVEGTLVLESVAGEPLADLLARGPITVPEAAEIGARVASALAHAHHHGVVHGRLGPASILVGDARHVWLVGLTASLREGEEPADGTPAEDLEALATTLRAAVGPDGADELEPVLEGTAGVSAALLSDRLFRFARTGIVEPLRPPAPRLTPLSATPPVAVGPAVLATGVGGSPRSSAARAGSSGVGRRVAGRGARVAALGSMAAALTLFSGLVLWASGDESIRDARALVSPTAPAAVVPPPVLAQVPLAPGTGSSGGASDDASSDDGDLGDGSSDDDQVETEEARAERLAVRAPADPTTERSTRPRSTAPSADPTSTGVVPPTGTTTPDATPDPTSAPTSTRPTPTGTTTRPAPSSSTVTPPPTKTTPPKKTTTAPATTTVAPTTAAPTTAAAPPTSTLAPTSTAPPTGTTKPAVTTTTTALAAAAALPRG